MWLSVPLVLHFPRRIYGRWHWNVEPRGPSAGQARRLCFVEEGARTTACSSCNTTIVGENKRTTCRCSNGSYFLKARPRVSCVAFFHTQCAHYVFPLRADLIIRDRMGRVQSGLEMALYALPASGNSYNNPELRNKSREGSRPWTPATL